MPIPLRALLIEDEEDHALLIERELARSGFSPQVERVETAAELTSALNRARWDIILSDFVLPNFSALAALRVLRGRLEDVPVIIVSGAIGEETAVTAMQAGARDFIRKGNWARLGPAIERELHEAENRRHRREVENDRAATLERERSARATAEQTLLQLLEANRQLADTNDRLEAMSDLGRRERDRLGQVLELLPAGILIADAQGKMVLTNAAARETLGNDPVGQTVQLREPHAYGERFLDGSPYTEGELPMARALFRGETVRDAQMLVRNAKTGRDIALLVNAAPFRDGDGNVTGAIVVTQDISEIRDLDRAREEFLASAAHDLQNPLTGIKGHAQLLRRQLYRRGATDTEWIVPSLQQIENAAAHMSGLVADLLDLARLRIGHPLELNRNTVDLVALVKRQAGGHSGATDRHRIVVEANEPEVVGFWDSRRLEQVLRNLITNAIKFSPDGGKITVMVGRDDEGDGPHAVIKVIDQGIGIPASEQSSLFGQFYRATNAVGRIDGTGLGLSSAKQIVEQHGGTISVESEERQGATFIVRLPLNSPTDG
jgi:signal transduction histidine kinase/DNA-binding response OmpR family regulator